MNLSPVTVSLGYNLGGDFTERFKMDKEPLERMKTLIEEQLKSVTKIRMWAFQYLLKVVEGCIKRCEGERDLLTENM